MRHSEQLPLSPAWISHRHAQELSVISSILDNIPELGCLVEQDLLQGLKVPKTGARGLSGDQVLRILVAKMLTGESYRDLEFRLNDSVTYRAFCRLDFAGLAPSYQTLRENISKIRPQTLEVLNQCIVKRALELKPGMASKVMLDTTVAEVNIHAPTDSSLLFDAVRILSRLLKKTEELVGFKDYSNHTKVAKRRLLRIQSAKPKETQVRETAYRELLTVTEEMVSYSELALVTLLCLQDTMQDDVRNSRGYMRFTKLITQLTHFIALATRVISQTERRVFHNETVPATEKVVSLVEPHADVIRKDNRNTLYGHKVAVSTTSSGLVLDVAISKGNPADATLALPIAHRLKHHYGLIPDAITMDGAFASKNNLESLKSLGINNVCFAKKRGIDVLDMVTNNQMYRTLRNLRAGVESIISRLKRVFWLVRYMWKGDAGYISYIHGGVLAANLLIMAQTILRQ